MKTLPLLILLWLCAGNASFAQHEEKGRQVLLRENNNDAHHVVYIDHNKSSNLYAQIAAFRFDETDQESYRSSVVMLKQNNPKLFTKHKLYGLPRQWCRLYLYKNQYYLYSPCDYIFNYRVAVSDTTYIDYWGDGPMASRMDRLQKINATSYRLELTTAGDGRQVKFIHIIDQKKGIAVFEDPDAIKPRDRYMLMVDASKIRHFAIIVNACQGSKQREYNFGEPDFNTLLHR